MATLMGSFMQMLISLPLRKTKTPLLHHSGLAGLMTSIEASLALLAWGRCGAPFCKSVDKLKPDLKTNTIAVNFGMTKSDRTESDRKGKMCKSGI
jgi:hypothetical protein